MIHVIAWDACLIKLFFVDVGCLLWSSWAGLEVSVHFRSYSIEKKNGFCCNSCCVNKLVLVFIKHYRALLCDSWWSGWHFHVNFVSWQSWQQRLPTENCSVPHTPVLHRSQQLQHQQCHFPFLAGRTHLGDIRRIGGCHPPLPYGCCCSQFQPDLLQFNLIWIHDTELSQFQHRESHLLRLCSHLTVVPEHPHFLQRFRLECE